MANFIWGAGGARMTPEQIAAQQKVSEAMSARGMDASPVDHWSQGVARVAQGMLGGYGAYRADQAGKANTAADQEYLKQRLSAASAPDAAPAVASAAPSGSVSEPMGNVAIPAGKEEFVSTVMPLAVEASKKTGVDPRIIVAQAALESNWGKSAPGNNLFGIKSHGQPGGNVLPTTEVVNGQPVRTTSSFRAYANPAESVSGYADFITQNPRYKPMREAQGMDAQIAALGQSGYATDPQYGTKVAQIARGLPGGAPQATSGGLDPRDIAVIASPYSSEGTKKIATILLQQKLQSEGVTTVDLGNAVGVMDKRGNIVRQIPKSRDPLDAESKDLDLQKKRKDLESAPTVQRIKQPDGSEVAVQWDAQRKDWVPLKAPEGGNAVANPKLTEQQSKDVGFYNRGQKLLPRLVEQDKSLTELPSAVGGAVSNYFKSDSYRQAEQTGKELLAVILRKDTGAAVTPSEFEMYNHIYLPRPGDDTATIEQKRIARQTAIEGLRMGLGTADIIFRSQEAAKGAAPAAPANVSPAAGSAPKGTTKTGVPWSVE